MTRKLPWKRASDAHIRNASASSPSPKPTTPRPSASTPTSASALRRPTAIPAAFNSSDPLRSPSTSPPPEPPQERYMIPGDDQFRIVEDELLQTAQRFTAHLHRAEYNRLKLVARSKNDAAIREIRRPIVGALTSDAKRRRDRAIRLSKQRSVLSAAAGSTQDGNEGRRSPWVGTNLRGLLDASRAEIRPLAPQTAASASVTRAAAGHRPGGVLAATTPRRKQPPLSSRSGTSNNATTPVSVARARHPVTPASSGTIASSSSAPSRHAKAEPNVHNLEDDLDLDDPFGLNKRRLDRQKSRDQLRKSIRKTPTNTPSSSDTMPSFV